MLAPSKGRSQLQTVSGAQLIGIEQLPSQIAQRVRGQNLPPRSAQNIQASMSMQPSPLRR
jgi:hypothetical protein